MDKTHDVIEPLIRQHAADAGFYWSQIWLSQYSSLQDKQDIVTFNDYLDAHLEGLIVAGDTGWNEAFKNLRRWKTQGEAFVCGYLAHYWGNVDYLQACWDIVKHAPTTTLQGYTSALTYLPLTRVRDYIDALQSSSDELELSVLLGALAGHQQPAAKSLISSCLKHESIEVKIALCRYIQALRLTDYLPDLYQLNQQDNLLVKHASAMAIGWLDYHNDLLENVFVDTITAYLNAEPERGLAGLQHQKRLEELVRLAGQLFSVQSIDVTRLQSQLTGYLNILFWAHSGQPDCLPYLSELLNDDQLGRLAFWAIHLLTGLDIHESSYILPAKEEALEDKPLNQRHNQLSIGIGKPNVAAIHSALLGKTWSKAPILLGKAVSEHYCTEVLAQDRQVARYIASWHLARLNPTVGHIDIRWINPQQEPANALSA